VSVPKRGLPAKRRMRHDRHFVDELARRTGEGIGRMIPTTQITSNHDQPRTALGDLSDLSASIKRHGILEPLLVRPRPGTPGTYELISGERRFHAALEAGLEEVPCIQLDVSDELALEIALIENLQRKDLSPFEEAEGVQTLVDKYGYTHQEAARAIGKSRVTVTETLQLLAIPPAVRERCRHADINAKGVLLEIAKTSSEEAMQHLLDAYLERHLDRAALRRLRREMEGLETARTADEAPAAGEEADADGSPAKAPRRFVWRFRHPERPFSLALTFRTETEPDPNEVVRALEEILADLRAQLGDPGHSPS